MLLPVLTLPVPIYTPGQREALWESSVLPKNTTQCTPPGLEPGPLDPESSSLTMSPPRLPPERTVPFKTKGSGGRPKSMPKQVFKIYLAYDWMASRADFLWRLCFEKKYGAVYYEPNKAQEYKNWIALCMYNKKVKRPKYLLHGLHVPFSATWRTV